MQIWESIPLMTAVDLGILAATVLAVLSIQSRRADIKRLGLLGPALVSAGIALMASVFLADLVLMWVLPLFTSAQQAHAAMTALHLNWSWLVMLLAALTLSGGVVSTVRELHRAERTIEKGEDLYRGIVEAQSEFIVRWLPDGTRTFVNEAYCRYFDQPAEDLVGTSFMPLVDARDRDAIRRKIESLSPQQPAATFTHRVVRPDQSQGWQEWTDKGFFDESGVLLHLQSVGRDVSEQVEAEQALRASEERYRAVFNLTTNGFVVRRLSDGKLVDVNPAMAGFHGYSPQEFLATSLEDLVAPESLAGVEGNLEALRRGEETAIEGKGLRRDGSLFDLEGFFVPFEHMGESHGLGVLKDVTERNSARRALEASEEKFAKAFEASPGSIAITSVKDGRLLEVNDRFLSATNLSREEAIGRKFKELGLWRDLGLRKRLLAQWRRGENLGPHEIAMRTVAGPNRIMEVTAALFEAEGEERLMAVGRDITERRLAEEELRQRYQFESLTSELSARFIHVDASRLESEIERALQLLVESLGVDRGGLFQLENGDSWPLRHRWSRPGIAPLPTLDLGDFPWLLDKTLQGELILISGADELPPEAAVGRRWRRDHGERGLAGVPLVVEESVLGLLVFGSFRENFSWPATATQRLQLVADMMANTLARIRADSDVRESEERLRAAYEEAERLKQELERERDYLREEVSQTGRFGEIVGESAALERVLTRIDAVANTHASVLIQGESGVGKELVARAIHASSERSVGPLVKVNCPAVPRELFESEFFGHVRGAFTGAHRDRVGRFQLAHGGTIFLDEVSEIPLDLQAKLLRVLQEGEFQRVGEETTRKVDVRVIAATNRGLKMEMRAGRFREDLYYRLSVFPIEVPALRQRREDILPLAHHFVARACQQLRRPKLGISQFQGQQILRHDWPGNVRELQNVIEQAVILSPGERLRLDLVLPGTPKPSTGEGAAGEPEAPREPFVTAAELKRRERDNITAALRYARWKISGPGGAAELLDIKPSTLSYQIKVLGIEKPS